MRGPRERHPEGTDLDFLSIVVLPNLERVVKAPRIRTDCAREPVEHLKAPPAGHVEASTLVAGVRTRDFPGQRQQIEHVVDVHVGDHDRVDLADQPARPRTLERARPEVEQHRGRPMADQIAGACAFERHAHPESEHLDPHAVSIRIGATGKTR